LTASQDEPHSLHVNLEAELAAQSAVIADLIQKKHELGYELGSYQNAEDADVQVGSAGILWNATTAGVCVCLCVCVQVCFGAPQL